MSLTKADFIFVSCLSSRSAPSSTPSARTTRREGKPSSKTYGWHLPDSRRPTFAYWVVALVEKTLFTGRWMNQRNAWEKNRQENRLFLSKGIENLVAGLAGFSLTRITDTEMLPALPDGADLGDDWGDNENYEHYHEMGGYDALHSRRPPSSGLFAIHYGARRH